MRTTTKYFGELEYAADAPLEFPAGLPGFEQHRRFLAVEMEEHRPLVFMQSLEDPELCFVTLPALSVDPDYRLDIAETDLALLGARAGRRPRIGRELLCLVIVTITEKTITANLRAPLLVNVENRRGVQAIATESAYSHQHVLTPVEVPVC